jgi:RNA polymerase II transcription initiation/nucleotide excision repair factor TFIIH, subunit TFB4
MPVWTSYTFVTFLVQQNVALDVCSLDQDLGLLQQGCDITGGLYLRIPQLQGLLQYLLVMQGFFCINLS